MCDIIMAPWARRSGESTGIQRLALIAEAESHIQAPSRGRHTTAMFCCMLDENYDNCDICEVNMKLQPAGQLSLASRVKRGETANKIQLPQSPNLSNSQV